MRTCVECKHASWLRVTKTGRLHPSGEGTCSKEYKLPPLPASMFWSYGQEPKPLLRPINRREQLDEHCKHWERA